MKNLTKFLCLLLIGKVLFCSAAFAQSMVVQAHFKNGDDALKKVLQKSFSKEYKKAKTCGISIVFAKFNVDTNGNIKNLVFLKSAATPDVFKSILTTVIESTNGQWAPAKVNGKKVDSNPFLLPLLYDLEAECKFPDSQLPNTTYEVLYNLLNFGDTQNVSQLECTILQPLVMFSQR